MTDVVPACQFGGFISPGQTISKSCLVVNQLFADATVHHFVVQDSITVYDEDDRVVTGADRDTYIGFFRMSVETQRILTAGDPANGEWDDRDVVPLPRAASDSRPVCTDRKLTDLVGDEDRMDTTACRVGRVRALGSVYPQREYVVRLAMLDDGDQTRFSGWGFSFDERQQGRAPALTDCGYWTCDVRGPGLYER